jgi:beta-lactam-binding protein with PASTA domain
MPPKKSRWAHRLPTNVTPLSLVLVLLVASSACRRQEKINPTPWISDESWKEAATALASAARNQHVFMVGDREPQAQALPDTVVRQALPPGTRIARGQPVSVTLAVAMPVVPDVAGKSVDDATQTLEEAGYAVQVSAALHSPEVAKGLIVAQSPKAGTALDKKSAVVVQPSAGPESLEVPKLVGLRLPAAKESIEKAGL